jgi:hypothetical protein
MVWLFECLVCVKLKCRYTPEVGFGIYGPKRVLGADNGRGKFVLYYNYILDSRRSLFDTPKKGKKLIRYWEYSEIAEVVRSGLLSTRTFLTLFSFIFFQDSIQLILFGKLIKCSITY